MPEGPEIETDRLHEAIQEEMEREGGGFLKRIALSTAVLAALAAIAALEAGATVNEALLLKTESTRLQTQASDQWSYFQAKGLKAAVQEATAASWEAAGKPVPERLRQQAERYAAEQAEIKASATEKERERDEKSAESDHLLHRHHHFAHAVALFQVSIALGALAALTRSRAVWWGSMLLGLSGIPLFVLAFLR
jgi:ABC-type multidrug transport system fused ATPase/permease subunit